MFIECCLLFSVCNTPHPLYSLVHLWRWKIWCFLTETSMEKKQTNKNDTKIRFLALATFTIFIIRAQCSSTSKPTLTHVRTIFITTCFKHLPPPYKIKIIKSEHCQCSKAARDRYFVRAGRGQVSCNGTIWQAQASSGLRETRACQIRRHRKTRAAEGNDTCYQQQPHLHGYFEISASLPVICRRVLRWHSSLPFCVASFLRDNIRSCVSLSVPYS